MKRSFSRSVAFGVVGVLLFAQLAIAAYTCPAMASALAAGAPTHAMATSAVAPDAIATTAQPGDCDDMAAAAELSSANLCAEHCKYGQQSDQASTLIVPMPLLIALYATPLVPPAAAPPLRQVAAHASALVAAAPPHAILHCVYRI